MNVKNQQLKKSLPLSISLVLGLLFTFLQIPQAYADQCLSQFPDSAWSKGEPKEIPSLLNRDLVRTKKVVTRVADQKELPNSIPNFGVDDITSEYLNNSRIEFIGKLGFVETKYPVLVTFEYQGSSCSTRKVEVSGGSVTYKPYKQAEFSDSIAVKNMFTNYDNQDFLAVQKKVDAVNELSKLLISTQSTPLKISSINITDDSSFARWLGLEKNMYPVIGYPSLSVFSEDGCLTNSLAKTEKLFTDSFNKLTVVEKTFYQRNLYGFFDQIQFSQGKKLCKLRVTTSFPSSYKNYLNKVEPVQLYGYVWVTDNLPAVVVTNSKTSTSVSNAKKTITCVKGKVSKKVTGLNPKCPAGYTLKK
jgi:hypothetical protein